MNPAVDIKAAAAAVKQLLRALGEDPEREELRLTPQRVADTFAQLCAGVGADPLSLLQDTFPLDAESSRDIIVVKELEFDSLCEHHLMPFRGVAHIAYLPEQKIVGFGTLPKLLAAIAARPQMQERLTEEVAGALEQGLGARGVLVVLEAEHGCLSDRALKQRAARVITVASRGQLQKGDARAQALNMLGSQRDCA